MKGQFFLISAIVIIIVLFLIKSSLDLTKIIENKRSLESSISRKEFLNVKNGLIRTIEYSYNKNEGEKIENYLNYVRFRLKSKTIELKGIAVEASYRNVTAGSDTGLNVTIFNFLGEPINNLNLSFSYDGSSQSFFNFEDGTSIKKDFVFNTISNVNYTLTLTFTTSKEINSYNITIPVEIGKNKFVGFFDLEMVGWEIKNRDKFSIILEIV
ncbi:MAG: hypothetical protein QXR09_01585 [Candidatus Aenigmatarchaeota archaeon]